MKFSKTNGVLRWLMSVLAVLLLWVHVNAVASTSDRHQISTAVMTLQSAQLRSMAGSEQVTLPFVLQPRHFDPRGSRVRFVLEVDLPEMPAEAPGIFINKVSLGAKMYLNGYWVADCETAVLEILRCLYRPWLQTPPLVLWKPGRNVLELEVYANDRQMNGLSAVHIGPSQVLDAQWYVPGYMLKVLA